MVARNPTRREFLDPGTAVCGETARERADLKDATERWHQMMAKSGYKPRASVSPSGDGIPRRIGPATVPMGGSSLSDV